MKFYILLVEILCSLILVNCQINFNFPGQVNPSRPNRPNRPRPRPRPRPPHSGGGGGGGGIGFPTDQIRPKPITRFDEGCQCKPANDCPRNLGQLQHGCLLDNGGKGICCINQEGIVVTRFGAVNPASVGPVSVSQNSMSNSLDAGQDGFRKIQQADQRRLSNGQFLPRLVPARGHAKFFHINPSWRENNNFAYQLALATQNLAKRENLNPAEAQFGLSKTRTTPQSFFGQRCPNTEPIRCGRTEEKFRTIDGSCNNLRDPRRGMSETGFSRLRPALYQDGIMSPRTKSVLGSDLPNVRKISSNVHIDRDEPSRDFTLNVMQWAQFMDHDLTHAPFPDMNGEAIECCEDGQIVLPQPRQCFTIKIPSDDGFFNLQRPPQDCINFVRSMFAIPPGCRFGAAEQLNALTHWVDGSMVYGSIEDEFLRVRDPNSPKLRVTRQQRGLDLLPTNSSIDCEARRPTSCFVAGDSRVNEQPGLTTMHTILVREHNRIVDFLQDYISNPEELFQEARRIVIAQIQHITYDEWLPIVVGGSLHRSFGLQPLPSGFNTNGYDPGEDPTMSNEFATAAFRFGHSLVQGFFQLFAGTARESFVQLRDVFNDPRLIQENPSNIDAFIYALVGQQVQDLDSFITRDLSNYLFQTPNVAFGMDLLALNINRGRDHAISTYNDMREIASGSSGRARDFSELQSTHDIDQIIKLQRVYAHVDDIDLFPGGMTERHTGGGLLGPTFSSIVGGQFKKAKVADRFFYEFPESGFTEAEVNEIKKSSMARMFCDNSRVGTMQPNAFIRPQSGNSRTNCDDSRAIPKMNLAVFAQKFRG